MRLSTMCRCFLASSFVPAGLWSVAASAQTPVTTIVNASFETGTPGQPVGAGWATAPGYGPMFVVDSSIVPLLEGIDPVAPSQGLQFITGNRNAGGYPTNQPMGVFQDVDLTPYSGEIGLGDRRMQLSFAYNDADPDDNGVVSFNFFDSLSAPIGNTYSFQTNSATTAGGEWSSGSLIGDLPAGAATMRISLLANQGPAGTLRNINYDAISASILPPPPPPPPSQPSGFVHGNLIQLDGNGVWTWYSDERAVVDPNNGHVLVNSTGFSPSYPSGGGVDVVNFDPATGRRVRTPLATIQVDDHNNGSLIVLPDGRYMAMYSNHGNLGMGDFLSRYRISSDQGATWTPEQAFNWQTVTGWNTSPNANNKVSYHNLYYLSADDENNGRLYNFSRGTHQSANVLVFDDDTQTWTWNGQLTQSSSGGYSTGYLKYASNGVDKIYFVSTETHPRNFNNNVWAGYISDNQTFDMQGNLIDTLGDNEDTGGIGAVPDITEFTLVQAADPLGQGYNRLWTVDMNLDAAGDPMALYISRWNPSGCGSGTSCDGGTSNPIDHRLHFARWDAPSEQWETHEVARMGNRLYRGTDNSEQDYTGNAALVPGDPSTIYVSTPYDPRDPSGETFTTSYEIYKGVTADDGATWDWTAITENSVVDNLRPIIPDPRGGPVTVMWFRGRYTTAHNLDTAIVGIVDRPNEQLGPIHYVDATTANTTRAAGGAIGATGPSANQGLADGAWHERTGIGNGGSVLTSSESGSEDAPRLKTTIDGATLEDGTYDVFAYFWSDDDEDWRLLAGLEPDNLTDFRRYGSQFAEADQFQSIETVSANDNDLLLYRAYLGRTEVSGGADIDVFIDDWQSFTGSAIRTWYDGVGYALVTPVEAVLAGDYNDDGRVDAGDYVRWRNALAGIATIENETASPGSVDTDDYTEWKNHYGDPGSGGLTRAVPEPAAWLSAMFACAAMAMWRGGGIPVGGCESNRQIT